VEVEESPAVGSGRGHKWVSREILRGFSVVVLMHTPFRVRDTSKPLVIAFDD